MKKDTKDTAEISAVFHNSGFLRAIEHWYGEKIDFYYEGDFIAYRSQNKTSVNLNNSIINSFAYLSARKLILYGLLGHEYGHALYTDFETLTTCFENMEKNKIFPYGESELENISHYEDFKANVGNAGFIDYFHRLSNILEDMYIEYRLITESSSCEKYGVGIEMVNKRAIISSPTLQSLYEKATSEENKIPMVYIFDNGLLNYKYGEMVVWGNKDVFPKEVVDLLYQCIDVFDEAMYDHSQENRLIATAKVSCLLWEYIEPLLTNDEQSQGQESQGNQSQQSQGQQSQENQSQQSQNTHHLDNSTSAQAKNSTPVNKTEAREKLQKAKEKIEKKINSASSSSLANMAENTVEGALVGSSQEEAQEKHAEAVLQKTEAATIGTIAAKVAAEDLHKGCYISYMREDVTELDRREYKKLKASLSKEIKLVSNVLKNVNSKCNKGKSYNYMGKKFVSRRAYRTDLKSFNQCNAPQEKTNFKIVILCDNSGSMSGENIKIAKKTMCLLYESIQDIENCDIEVNSHNTYNSLETRLRRCIINKKDTPYRIMELFGEGSNRDGFALKTIYENFKQSTDKNKTVIFFYINDGCPADRNYCGEMEEVLKELNSFSKQMEKENIIFLVAGIDGDKERLEKLYGQKHFLNIEKLEELPKRLSSILRNLMKG